METSYSLSELAQQIDGKVIGDDQINISGLAPLHLAKAGELTFLLGGHYRSLLADTKASAVILTEADSVDCPSVSIVVDDPEVAFAKVASLFDRYQRPKPGIHPTAVIADSAKIAASVSIGAHCVIGENVIVGENTVLSANVTVGEDVTIGDDCLIYSAVTLYHGVLLGDRVILHSGAVIGADGFGLVRTKSSWEKMPQIGGVRIGNDVEIGANSCIDRGALIDTVIYDGVKIDNLVQIAHNVEVGAHTVIAGCAAIAGSTKIGARCVIGGAVSISGHITICDGAVFTGMAMVTGSVKQPGVYSSGTGLLPSGRWRKMAVRLRQLDSWMRSQTRT